MVDWYIWNSKQYKTTVLLCIRSMMFLLSLFIGYTMPCSHFYSVILIVCIKYFGVAFIFSNAKFIRRYSTQEDICQWCLQCLADTAHDARSHDSVVVASASIHSAVKASTSWGEGGTMGRTTHAASARRVGRGRRTTHTRVGRAPFKISQ